MKILNQLKDVGEHFKEYIESEKELLKLKAVKAISGSAAQFITAIFLIMLFHIALAIFGIWLGVYLGEILDSYTLGFGISALAFVFLFILIIVFRKPLLINPITNAAISAMVKNDKISDEDEKRERP